MLGIVRRLRIAGAVVCVLLCANACTSGQARADPSTSSLTPGGTAYPLPTAALPPSSTAALSGSPSTTAAASSTGGSPDTARSTATPSTPASPTPGTPAKSSPSAASTPGTTSTRSSAARPTPTSSSTPSLNTTGLSATEIADRRAIEAVWIRYWDVYVSINNISANKRLSLLALVAVDPVKSKIISSAALYDREGFSTYGTVSHRIYLGSARRCEGPSHHG